MHFKAKSINKTCGMLYEIQTEVQTIPILHLYCGAFEMGRAQGIVSLHRAPRWKLWFKSSLGTLMKNRIMSFYTELEEYTIGIYSEKIRDYVRSRYPTLAGMNKQISEIIWSIYRLEIWIDLWKVPKYTKRSNFGTCRR